MNQEQIIQMAREAGLDPDLWNYTDAFERFAKLVAEHERERIKQANAPEIERVNTYIKELEDAVKAEREACLQIVESEAMQYAEPVWAFEIVNDIKARDNVATNDTSQERVDETAKQQHEPCGLECDCTDVCKQENYKALWQQMCERCDELDKKLAQQAEPDYYGLTKDHLWMSITKDHYDRLKPEFRMACYTSPPPRQPLTDEEIEALWPLRPTDEVVSFARAIEAAVWEKQK